MPSDDIKFVLRVPAGMYAEAKRVSELEGLSLNQWILKRAGLDVQQGGGTNLKRPGIGNRVVDAGVRKTPATGVVSGESASDVEESSSTVGSSPTPATKLAGHDTKNCRVYRCGQCKVLGVKDKGRGLE